MTKQTRFRTSGLGVTTIYRFPFGTSYGQAFFERFGLDTIIGELKSQGTALDKLAEQMVAYKIGDDFSILKCHDLAMMPPVREHLGLPGFDVRGLYRAVETLGENRERTIDHFRRTFLRIYGPEIADTVFD